MKYLLKYLNKTENIKKSKTSMKDYFFYFYEKKLHKKYLKNTSFKH